MYKFDIEQVQGAKNAGADAASRYPVAPRTPESGTGIEQAAIAHATQQAEGMRSVTWERINMESAIDEECRMLVDLIQNGFPTSRSDVPPKLRQFWKMKDELYTIGNIPYQGHKMLIPYSLRKENLEGLHAAHNGVIGMTANERERLF